MSKRLLIAEILWPFLPVIFGIAIAVYEAIAVHDDGSVAVIGFILIILGGIASNEDTRERVGESYSGFTHTIYYRTKPIEEWGAQFFIGAMIYLIGLGMIIGDILLWKPIDFLLGIGIVFGIPYIIIKHLLENYPPLNYVVSVIGVSISIYFLSIIKSDTSIAFSIGAVMGFYFLVLACRQNV